jgi:hypothetical protein
MYQAMKIPLLVLCVALLAACEIATPKAADTAMVTSAPNLTPVIRTSTPTQSVTKISNPTIPASTSTFAPPTSATSPGPNAATETQEAQVFCYQDPRKALDDFLTYLYQGEYEKAANAIKQLLGD